MSSWLPYQWNKKTIVKPLVDFILNENPSAKYVYDLFGGWASVSLEFLSHGLNVVYNEKSTAICELLKYLQKNWVTPECYEWIDREAFHTLKVWDDWRAGLVRIVWSFGNNGKTYLFSQENEQLKKPLHILIVDWDDEALFQAAEKELGITIPRDVFTGTKSINERRLKLMGYIKKNKWRCDLEQLEQLQQLERLEQLQRLQRLQQLVIQNKSYDEVIIDTPIEETIIYLDPPYQNAGWYNDLIDFTELKKWILNCPYKIYMSEYACDYLREVFSIEKRVTLSPTRSNLKKMEKLFTNK